MTLPVFDSTTRLPRVSATPALATNLDHHVPKQHPQANEKWPRVRTQHLQRLQHACNHVEQHLRASRRTVPLGSRHPLLVK